MMPARLNQCALLALVSVLPLAGASVWADEPIMLYYNDRPPYMSMDALGRVTGISATPAIAAFTKAGIAFELHESSPERQLRTLKRNDTRACNIGWFKNPERETFAKFSRALSQDSAMVAVGNADFTTPVGVSVEALLANPDLRVLVKDSVSYGPTLQALFATMNATKVRTAAEYPQLLRMIQGRRADIVFMPLEQAIAYTRASARAQTPTEFSIIQFVKPVPGEARYIMCSMLVEDSTIAKINAALGSDVASQVRER